MCPGSFGGNLYGWPKLKGPNEIWHSPKFSMKYGLLLSSTSCEFIELPQNRYLEVPPRVPLLTLTLVSLSRSTMVNHT